MQCGKREFVRGKVGADGDESGGYDTGTATQSVHCIRMIRRTSILITKQQSAYSGRKCQDPYEPTKCDILVLLFTPKHCSRILSTTILLTLSPYKRLRSPIGISRAHIVQFDTAGACVQILLFGRLGFAASSRTRDSQP
jgi:hypothetical protein